MRIVEDFEDPIEWWDSERNLLCCPRSDDPADHELEVVYCASCGKASYSRCVVCGTTFVPEQAECECLTDMWQ